MNEEMKRIFTIEIDKEYDEKLFNTFTHGLKKRVSAKLHDESIMDKPYYPGIAWLAYREVVPNTDFSNLDWWKPYAIQEFHKEFEKIQVENGVMEYKGETPEVKEKLQRAYDLLNKSWFEAKEQLEQFVMETLLYEGNGKYNSASGWAYGTLFFTIPPNLNAVDMVDYLLHEQGHLVLMTKQAFGKMIVNENDLVYSPFRNEKRWLNGVLHAIFVTARVCEGMTRLKTIEGELTEEEKVTANKIFKENLMIYQDSLKNLDEVAQYTEIGEYVISQLREKVKRFEGKTEVF